MSFFHNCKLVRCDPRLQKFCIENREKLNILRTEIADLLSRTDVRVKTISNLPVRMISANGGAVKCIALRANYAP